MNDLPQNLPLQQPAIMRNAYRVLFLGTEYSVLIPKDFYTNKIDVVDTCDFCVIIRNKDGFSYENVTINDIRNSLKNNDYPKQTDLFSAVRRWNEFDFFKKNDVYDTCLRCNGKGRVTPEYPTFCVECQNKYLFKYSNSIHYNRCVLHYAERFLDISSSELLTKNLI
jgi:hypothetical protein